MHSLQNSIHTYTLLDLRGIGTEQEMTPLENNNNYHVTGSDSMAGPSSDPRSDLAHDDEAPPPYEEVINTKFLVGTARLTGIYTTPRIIASSSCGKQSN